jgi:hypothetical protein
MTAENFYQAMIERLRRKPFRAFVVEVNDGQRVEIDRPNTVSIRAGTVACSTRDCFYVRLDCQDVVQFVDKEFDPFSPAIGTA